jgi:CO/xanthine dehydrogenase Mo-binding subunit
MATRFFGERIKRNEDPRLLAGNALFVDDAYLPNMAHVAFVRSPHTRARIKSVDTTGAMEQEDDTSIITATYLPPKSFPI